MAESRTTVIYALLGSAVVMLAFAGFIWTRTIDLDMDPTPLAALLVLGAVMDVVVAAIFLRKLSR